MIADSAPMIIHAFHAKMKAYPINSKQTGGEMNCDP
jgi:hypothetical protein